MGENEPTREELEQRLAELEASSAEQFKTITESSPDAIFIVDQEGNYQYVNQAACEMLGYTADELTQMNLMDLSLLDLAEFHLEQFEQILAEGRGFFESDILAKDGRIIPVDLNAVVLPDGRVYASCRDISERKRAEAALRASEATARVLLDAPAEIMLLLDGQGGLLSLNEAAADLLGGPRRELIGRCVWDLLAPGVVPERRQRVERALRTDKPERWEDANGDRIYENTAYRIRGADRSADRVAVYAVDITERRRAEEESRRLGATVEEATVGVALSDLEGNLTYVNQTLCEAYGYSADELIGQPAFTLHADTVGPVAVKPAMLEAGRWSGEVLQRRKDGSTFPALLSIFLVRDPSGEPESVVAFITDLSEQIRAQRALRQSEERLRAVFRSSTDSLILLDEAHRVQVINWAGPDVDMDDLLGDCILDVLPKELVAEARAALDRVLSGAGEERLEVPYRRPDGSVIHYEAVLAPVVAGDEVIGSLVSARDVTDRFRLEAQKDQLERQFLQSQKMEAVGSLAGGVAHDFNNLLTVINSYAGFAVADLKEGDPLRDDVQQILDAGRRAASLTRQLLAFSRRQVMEPRVLDLNEVIGDMEKMLRRLIGEHIDLQIDLADDLGRVNADPAQLEQVLMNLAVNARDAMPTGGELCIETADVSLDAACAERTPDASEGDHVCLVVSDTGLGMSAAQRERIFEPFFTTKEKGQGTGLGLATVYGIVRQSGGHIAVESTPGQGATFKVYLPRVEADEAAPAPRPEPEATSGTETILVVEDDRGVRDLARRILQAAGYQVLTAANGGEALLACERHEGAIELMLTDVVMPQMSGRELADRLARLAPGMRVVFMSGYTDDAIIHHGVLEAGTHFIGKPFTAPNLLRQVRICLDAD